MEALLDSRVIRSVICLKFTRKQEFKLEKIKRLIYMRNVNGFLSGVVYTRGESPWKWLGDAQTCGTTLVSAYVLYYLSTMWSQL